MNNLRKDIIQILSKKGVALLMILTAITLLTALLVDFTFDTKINKLKVRNVQDRIQARLNAEAGLKLSLGRLKLYKEAYNLLQKNKNLKGMITGEILNQVWSIPFIYPITATEEMNVIQKTAIKEFSDNALLDGSLKLVIQNASNLININLLRISPFLNKKKTSKTNPDEEDYNQGPSDVDNEFTVQKQLTKMLNDALERKREEDETFSDLYSDTEAVKLISALKHFVSDKNSYEDEYSSEFDSAYDSRNVTPKHAPLSSLSEILMIQGWDKTLLDLIINEITVHGVIVIDLNKVTSKTFKLLFPELEDEQVKEFFKFRDDPDDPQYFDTIKDFKKYIVSIAGFMDAESFDQMIASFEKAGLKFGTSGSLFRVISTGEYGRATYTLTAYISLPAKPVPPKKKKPKTKKKTTTPTTKTDQNDQPKPTDKKKEERVELLPPRIVEISIN